MYISEESRLTRASTVNGPCSVLMLGISRLRSKFGAYLGGTDLGESDKPIPEASLHLGTIRVAGRLNLPDG